MPAKASLTNTKQFNGEFGCIAWHPDLRYGRVNIYLFYQHYPSKTNEDNLHYSEMAYEKNKKSNLLISI